MQGKSPWKFKTPQTRGFLLKISYFLNYAGST